MTKRRKDGRTLKDTADGRKVRLGVLTVSDLGAQGRRDDTSGDAIAAWAAGRGHELIVRSIVPDETSLIAGRLSRWADSGAVDVILTTGGTGLAARDVTPEATQVVLERQAPGLAEALRAAAGRTFPRAFLSRGLAGVRGKTLIVNLPGSEGGVRDGLAVLDKLLEHAVNVLTGALTDHAPTADGGRRTA